MKKEKDKKFVQFEWKVDLNVIIIILVLLTIFWAINNNINSINQRVNGVYTVVSKSDKDIIEMKTGIEIRLTDIEKRLTAIETGISSLQPRDDSLKEPKPPGKPIPIPIPIPEPEPSPQPSPYQSP